MRFQIVPFSFRCIFKSIHFGLRFHNRLHRFLVNRRWKRNDIATGPKASVTRIRLHFKAQRCHCGFPSCLHGNDENDHEKAKHLNTQSKVDWFESTTKWKRNDLKTYPCTQGLRLWFHGAIYRLNSFASMLHHCGNLKAIRYESTSLDRIVADKSHRVIVA